MTATALAPTSASKQNGTSEHATNTSTSPLQPSRKRKRDDSLGSYGLRPFQIRPCPTSILDKPWTLTPISIIRRSQLPLSFLDIHNSSLVVPSTRFFSTRTPLLDSPGVNQDETAEAQVLIARFDTTGSLFAVEKVKDKILTLCKLGDWVKDDDFPQHAEARSIDRSERPRINAKETILDPGQWWKAAAVCDNWQQPKRSEPDSERIVMHASRNQPSAQPKEGTALALPSVQPSGPQLTIDDSEQSPPSSLGPIPQPESPDQIYANVVRQYLDTLYLSKTSLAYFAKGPLSRARAAFASKDNEVSQVQGLAVFLRQCLLIKSMDKKYRDKLPELVEKVADETPPNSNDQSSLKKSRSKKLKPSADGIFPREEGYLKGWWHSPDLHGPLLSSPEKRQKVIKDRLANLRVRESQMQLIIALEVLALESSFIPAGKKSEEPSAESQEQGAQDTQSNEKRKKKKLRDLTVFIDLIVDRLCIWQSLRLEGVAVKEQDRGEEVASNTPGALTGKPSTNDALKAFCIEVIIPFYMARLPKQAASVNKKLGGPSPASPIKPLSSKLQPALRKPGAPISRSKTSKPNKLERKPLHRVTSETINRATRRPSLAPTLGRSATDSTILASQIKRESSEVPSLSSIPARESSVASSSARPGTSRSNIPSIHMKRFSRCEVDLDAMTNANAAKLRRKAEIESKLKEAISTLKKPNRGVVGREVVEEAEMRKRSAPDGSKAANTGRNRSSAVQITATPKRGPRTRDVVMVTPHHRDKTISQLTAPIENGEDDENALHPPSSISFIPSTAIKPTSAGITSESWIPDTSHRIPDSARALMERRMNAGVAETPSRGPAKRVSFFTSSTSTAVEMKELKMKSKGMFSTPLKQAGNGVEEDEENVSVSPVPMKTLVPVERKLGRERGVGDEMGGQSLYDALGWNDEVDDFA
ncbi:MAG: hypothetical protein M1820_006843 [Bogoriella megaspora]|nr:MAG: hypothetical protein M1820_006843 [Bogoriella megaspora]